MKTSKTTYTFLLVFCTFLCIGIIGLISISTTKKILQENAEEKLTITSTNAKLQFDSIISSIEQSVDTLSSIALFHVGDFDRFKTDSEYVEEYTKSLQQVMLYSVENTSGASSIYLRYNPEFADPEAGLFYTKNKVTNKFIPTKITNLDTCTYEEATWWHIPVNNEKPTWMDPYENVNIGYRMISYVVPMYIDGELFGIVGMDIDYEYLKELIMSIRIYDSGYAFLLNPNRNIVVHKDYDLFDDISDENTLASMRQILSSEKMSGQYEYENGKKTISFSETKNGMYLAITAPNTEIYQDSYTLMCKLFVVIALTLVAIASLATYILHRMSLLSELDELTGIYNRKGFIRIYTEMDIEKRKQYSLFIFDIDKFKQVNDIFGHNVGDEAIIFTAQTAKKHIGKSGVIARWGGDEFIGLLKNEDAETLLEQIRKDVCQHKSATFGKLSVSLGFTKTKGRTNLMEITEIADAALYQSKTNGRNRLTYIDSI